jgi:catechol 2,3-dioxygenase-like lactoylglutathione lyase family enzyme
MKKIAFQHAGLGMLAGLGLAAMAFAVAAAPAAPAADQARPGAGGPPRGPGLQNSYVPGAPKLPFDSLETPRILVLDIQAHDAEKSAKFYEDVLGMKVWMRRGTFVFLGFPSKDGKTLIPPTMRIGQDPNYVRKQQWPNMVLVVDDALVYAKRYTDAGYTLTRNATSGMAFLTDPSGNVIEITSVANAKPILGPGLAP